MFSISFLSKLFALRVIFIIILTSVSTESKVYQMLKMNEDYYEYLSRPEVAPEEKMSPEDVYASSCNLEQRNIPTPTNKYDYESYKKSGSNFCPQTYFTFDMFMRQYHIKLYNYAVLGLKTCLKLFVDEDLGHKIREVFEVIPEKEFSDTVRQVIRKMKTSLNAMYIYDPKDNVDENMYTTNIEADDPQYMDCYNYKYNENKKDMQKFADYIKKTLSSILSPQEKENFFSCLYTFKGKLNNIIPDIIPGKKGVMKGLMHSTTPTESFTAKELLVAYSIIYNLRYVQNFIDVPKMFLVVFQLKILRPTNKEVQNCTTQFKTMSTASYTSSKLSYLLYPTFPIEDLDKNFSEYEIKRRMIINHLMAIDFKNKPFYSELLNINAQFDRNEFSKLIRRRAIKVETNYSSYAIRIMYLSEYLPLPRHLWEIERQNLEDKNIQEFFSQEQKRDLESYKSSINIK